MPLPMTIGAGRALMWRRRTAVSSGPALPVTPANNLVVGMGDSITVASHNTAGAGITYNTSFQPRLLNPSGSIGGYLTWAMILPKTGQSTGDGRFRFIGTHATGGANASAINTTHIVGTDSPLNDSPKAGICAVLAGTNDLGAIAPSNVVNNTNVQSVATTIEGMWDSLIAGGILPVCCLVPPNNGTSNNAVPALNAELTLRATAKGIPIADLYTPCVGTAPSWASGYQAGDGIHPSVLGAKAMGQALRDSVEIVLPATGPNLVTAATDATADLISQNGAMLRDGNSDGVPNGGGTAESNTYYTFTAAGATSSIGARTGFDGNAWTVNKSTDSGQTTASGSGAGNLPTLVDGHLYDLGFVFEVESWSGTTTSATLQLNKISDGSKLPFRLTLELDANFSGAIAPFKILRTFRSSDAAAMAPSGTYRWSFTWGHRTGSPTDNLIKTDMGQLTLRDLGVG